jgi:hypothetical protein
MRCPNCNIFVSMETTPEMENIDVSYSDADNSATVEGSVRCVRTCADCSEELKEYTFDIDETIDIDDAPGCSCARDMAEGSKLDEKGHLPDCRAKCEHDLTIDADEPDPTETGGSRYKKNMVGFSLSYTVKCNDCDFEETGDVADSAPASYFEELV